MSFSQIVDFKENHFQQNFDDFDKVLISIADKESFFYYDIKVKIRKLLGKETKFQTYGILRPRLLHTITKNNIKDSGYKPDIKCKIEVILEDEDNKGDSKQTITNNVTFHEQFNKIQINNKDSEGKEIVYDFELMNKVKKNKDFWQTPILCQGDYLELNQKENNNYRVTVLPFTYALDYYGKEFDDDPQAEPEIQNLAALSGNLTWFKIKEAYLEMDIHTLNLKLRFFMKAGYLQFLAVYEISFESEQKCAYHIDLSKLKIPNDFVWRTGVGQTKDNPGIKGYELIFAKDYHKEFWVLSFNYLKLLKMYTIRKVKVPYEWWNSWEKYVKFAEFDLNSCFVNILPLVEDPDKDIEMQLQIKDLQPQNDLNEYKVPIRIKSVQNKNIASVRVKKKIILNENNIRYFRFNFYEHFKQVGHMPIVQNSNIALDTHLQNHFTMEVDKVIPNYYPIASIHGGVVHIVKSVNSKFPHNKKFVQDKSSLLAYGINRQNLAMRVIAEGGKDKKIQYQTKDRRVKKIDFMVDNNGYNIMVLEDNPTNSTHRQTLVFDAGANNQTPPYTFPCNMKDFQLMPKLQQTVFERDDFFLGLELTGNLTIYQFNFTNIDAKLMLKHPIITPKGGAKDFENFPVVKSMDTFLLSVNQDTTNEPLLEIFVVTVAADTRRAVYGDKKDRPKALGYWVHFMCIYYDENEKEKYVNLLSNELDSILQKENVKAVTFVKTKFNPDTNILEILIDTNTFYLYIFEIKLLAKKEQSKTSIHMSNIKYQKYYKPHIFHHFSCDFSKNYLSCMTSSLSYKNKNTVNLLGWKRQQTHPINVAKEQVEPVQNEGIFPYKLRTLKRVNPLMAIVVEDYEKDIFTYLRCELEKKSALWVTEQFNQDIVMKVDIPASVQKPYNLDIILQKNPWVYTAGSMEVIFKTSEWIKLLKIDNQQNKHLKTIVFTAVLVILCLALLIVLFVIIKILKKKKTNFYEDTLTQSIEQKENSQGDSYQSFQDTSQSENVYSQISEMLEKAQNKRMANKNRDARRQRRKMLRERMRKSDTGQRESEGDGQN